MNKPVIVSLARTPMGRMMGAFANFSAANLGAVAIKEVVKRSQLDVKDIDHVIMGQVISAGCAQNTARQATIYADLPVSIGAITINKVCGSGMASVIWAAQMIKTGDMDVVIAGGIENMSMAPYLLLKGRQGYRYGNSQLIDSMYHDGLYDIYHDMAMGNTGDIVSKRYDISREEMDEFAYQSHQRAHKATKNGKFKDEIVPVKIKTRKGTTTVKEDEGIRPNTTLEALAKLRPAFSKEGKVTAGNASQISDGASAIVVMSEELAKEKGIPILAHIAAYGTNATKPEWVMEAPIKGVKQLLKKTDHKINDFDLIEHNEAFASASCAVRNELKISNEKFNVNGGAVALGHPLGCSGSRILVTLYHELAKRNEHKGLATICLGGGEAMSMIIER
ncbi:acetyl-CoA acetyltransferase [Candidatus Heimdallarchaeota archaeon B3_Heim]|nr:MAG: acetyl-CoA acetyltransferase [Candidatus Heimdallarchaeota archaeon B3_Heim]